MTIPAGVLVSGDNIVALTNDADISDGWTAAEVYLEVHGDLRLPWPTLSEAAPDASHAGVGAATAETGSVPLVSTYDGYYPHYVWYQVPDAPVSDPTPLLVVIHGWGGTGEVMLDFMGAAVNERGRSRCTGSTFSATTNDSSDSVSGNAIESRSARTPKDNVRSPRPSQSSRRNCTPRK